KAIGRSRRGRVVLRNNEIVLHAGRQFPLCALRGAGMHWHWPRREATDAVVASSGSLTVGPTLRYGKTRQPKALSGTKTTQIARLGRAWQTIELAWPEG